MFALGKISDDSGPILQLVPLMTASRGKNKPSTQQPRTGQDLDSRMQRATIRIARFGVQSGPLIVNPGLEENNLTFLRMHFIFPNIITVPLDNAW